MNRKNTIIKSLIILILIICLTACTGNNNSNNPNVYYQAKSLGLADIYYSINAMSFWDNNAYVLALDLDVMNNNTIWILVINHEGDIQKKISYKTEGYSSQDDWDSGNDIVDIEIDDDGGIWILEEKSNFQYTDEGQLIQQKMEYCVKSIDDNGKVLEAHDLDEINKLNDSDKMPFVHRLIIDKDDNFYFLNSSETEDNLFVYNNGEFSALLEGCVTSVSESNTGEVIAQIISNTSENEMALSVVDTVSWSWKEPEPASNYFNYIYCGQNSDLLLNDGSGLWGYNLETKEYSEILSWLDSDIGNGNIQYLGEFEDGGLIALAAGLNDLKNDIIILEPIPGDSMPERTILTLATGIATDELKKKVIEFNRSHTDYKIQLTEYILLYSTPNDSYAGERKLFTEILGGDIPDIIDFYLFPADPLIAADLLENLYPFLEKDPDISIDDFLPNLIDALEVDDALYRIPYQFYLEVVAGDSHIIGTNQGWTMEELYNFVEENEQYENVFPQTFSQLDFLRYAIRFDGGKYINYTEGTCDFNSEEFLKLLHFAKEKLPSGDIEFDGVLWNQLEATSSGEHLLVVSPVFDFYDCFSCIKGFNDNVNFIGFPTSSGVGNVFHICENFGITRASKNKDIAWEFIRNMFIDTINDYEHRHFFPATLSELKEYLSYQMSPYITDEVGEDVFTQKDEDIIWDMINSVDRVLKHDKSVEDIVAEDATAFFYNDKSAEEVAEIIQNRVQMMLSETE